MSSSSSSEPHLWPRDSCEGGHRERDGQPMRGQCAGHVICADQSEPGVGERRGSISSDHYWERKSPPGLAGDVSSGHHVWGRPRY